LTKHGHISLVSPDGRYYQVTQEGVTRTFLSKGEVDTLGPTTPSGLTATAVMNSSIDLTWSASTDDIALTGYNAYRSSANATFNQHGDVTDTHSSDDPGVGRFLYRVSAVEEVGNEAPRSGGAHAGITNLSLSIRVVGSDVELSFASVPEIHYQLERAQ